MRRHQEELRQVKEIIAGKPFLLQCVFDAHRRPLLMQLWRSANTLSDLPKSLADAQEYFATHDGPPSRRPFGSSSRRPAMCRSSMIN